MPTRPSATPEDWLRKAMAAPSPTMRGKYAKRGLSTRAALDRTTHTMLLRQLYLSHFESRRFELAHAVALQAAELDVLADVIQQDAARAALAAGNLDAAVTHLRTAARRGPPSRRAFHLWTLGSVLFLAARYDESVGALTRAARWGTRDKPLYRGHLALAQIARGEIPGDLQATLTELAAAPCGQGYGRFVLGHLAYAAGERAIAQRHLEAFIKRAETGRSLLGIALEGELRMARATLSKIASN